MTQIAVQIDPSVFNEIYRPHLNNTARIQIFFGGSGSGKSVFLAQRCVYDLLAGGRNYLVCRAVGRTVRKSVYNEIVKIIRQWKVYELFSFNKTDGTITCTNGYQAIFTGLDDTEKVKSITPENGAITDIWVEEATETERKSIKDLLKRQRGGDAKIPKRMTMSFNPILQSHWIYEEYFSPIGWHDDQQEHGTDGLSILKTWYIHNRWLTKDDVDDLLNESDEYYRNVYTFGNWGVLGDVIFTNWEVRDLSDMHDQFVDRRNGLDFGYSSDPAAVVQSHYERNRKTIYIYGELYETELTNDLLADSTKAMIGNDNVICDSAEPKSIAELQRYGVSASGAQKGKDSILHGIQWLQQQTIVVDVRCVNMINELRQYQWKQDAGGNPVSPPKPVDKNNHLIDALRYAYESESLASWAIW